MPYLVQSAQATLVASGSATTISVNFPSATTAGNFLIASATSFNSSNTTGTLTGGDTWSSVVNVHNVLPTNSLQTLWAVASAASIPSATSITFTVSNPIILGYLNIYEFQGVTGTLLGTNSAFGQSAAAQVATLSETAGSLIFGTTLNTNSSAITLPGATSPLTNGKIYPATSQSEAAGAYVGTGDGWGLATSATSYGFGGSTSSTTEWSVVLAAFSAPVSVSGGYRIPPFFIGGRH